MRRRRSKRRQRSAVEWGIRGTAALAAAFLAYASVSATLANVVVRIDPVHAHRLSPSDGQITAAAAEQSFALTPDASIDSEVTRLAQLALRQDATAVSALSVLGLQAQLRRDVTGARELFSYSHQLSRRELRTQIWAIEEAVARGDIASALEHYDRALRTSRRARDILFPVLARAIAEPVVRAPLLETLSSDSAWGRAFIRYVAANAPEPQAVVLFFREGARAGLPIEDDDRSRLVNALVAEGATDEAWSLYDSFRREASRERSRDPNFELRTQVPAVFDWTALNPQGLAASIQRGEDGGVVHFSAGSGAGGTVLRQMQLLPPGLYRIEGRSRGIDQPEYSRPYWALTCHDGQELGRVPLPSSGDTPASFTGRFRVPSECPVQTLSLVVRASDAIAGIQGQIDTVQLVPVS